MRNGIIGGEKILLEIADAEKISQHIVNLPTHIGMNHIDKVADFLKRNRANIYSNYEELLNESATCHPRTW